MIRLFFEWILQRAGERTENSPPTAYERALIQALYILPLLWLIWSVGSRALLQQDEPPSGHGIGDILGVTGALAAATVISLIWAVQYRKAPLEMWAVTHLIWITKAYTTLALYAAFGALAFAVMLLFALLVKPLAFMMIYGLPLVALVVMGGFLLRIISGYHAFLKRQPMGERKWRSRQDSNL